MAVTYYFIMYYGNIGLRHVDWISNYEFENKIKTINNKIKRRYTMTLVKFNPVRDLIDFEREFNKMFNSLENR